MDDKPKAGLPGVSGGQGKAEVTEDMVAKGIAALGKYSCYEDFQFDMGDIVLDIYQEMASVQPGTCRMRTINC